MRKIIPVTVADLTAGATFDFVNGGATCNVALVRLEGMTAGTLTLEYAMDGSELFEVPDGPNTIDLAEYASLTVTDASIGKIKATLTGFTGTATEIKLAVSTA